MHIDKCRHSFAQLASTVLPAHMKKLRLALTAPFPASTFAAAGKGPASIAQSLSLAGEFSGCYVLIDQHQPIYVGISRRVLARLRQHFTGKSHFDASLVYAVAQKRSPTKGTRSKVMDDPQFQKAFAAAQSHLLSLHVSFVAIKNPLELYIFEAFAAIELGTHEWNTFRTH